MLDLLAAEGVVIDGIYHCPHAPADPCRCRKPEPELVEKAVDDLDLDVARSFVIGDKPADVDLALRVGARPVLVRTGYGAESERDPRVAAAAPHVADDLAAAAEFVLSNGIVP